MTDIADNRGIIPENRSQQALPNTDRRHMLLSRVHKVAERWLPRENVFRAARMIEAVTYKVALIPDLVAGMLNCSVRLVNVTLDWHRHLPLVSMGDPPRTKQVFSSVH